MTAVLSLLYTPGILELRAIITKDHGKVFPEQTDPQSIHKKIECFDDFPLGASTQQDNDHKRTAAKQESQEAFTGSAASLNCIHFNDIRKRMLFKVVLKVLIGTLITVDRFDGALLRSSRFPALFVANSPWEIDVPGLENTLVKIVIERPPADRDLVRMYSEDM